jgi:hypothetical protein
MKRKLTDFDRWQLARLRRFLEAESGRTTVDWTVIAELQACKDYLADVGLGHLVPIFEANEQLRVRGAVFSAPKNLPKGCLVCFAAIGMDGKPKSARKK